LSKLTRVVPSLQDTNQATRAKSYTSIRPYPK